LQISHWRDTNLKQKRSQLLFYSVNKHSVFGMVEKGVGFFLADGDFIEDEASQNYHLNNHWSYLDLENKQWIDLDSNFQSGCVWKENGHIQMGNKKMIVLKEDFELREYERPIQVDFCLLSVDFPIETLLKSYKPKTLIIDSKLPHYLARKKEKECIALGLDYHNLKTKGALVVDLNF